MVINASPQVGGSGSVKAARAYSSQMWRVRLCLGKQNKSHSDALFDHRTAKKEGGELASPPCSQLTGSFSELLGLTEAPFIVDDRPGFFFRDRGGDQGHHPRSWAAVLNDPEELAIFPFLVELAVREIPWAWIQDLPGFTLAVPCLAMTIEAGALPLVERLAFGDGLRTGGDRILHSF